MATIEAHRDAHGGKSLSAIGPSDNGGPICAVLRIAPSVTRPAIRAATSREGTYFDRRVKRADPSRLSDRARRDDALRPEIQRVFEDNWSVYGVRKVWHQLRREGFDVGRSTVARLLKDMDIQGIVRGRPHRTTIPHKKQPCPLDKVNSQFRVPAPNMLWGEPLCAIGSRTMASDLTYVATWRGIVYAPRANAA